MSRILLYTLAILTSFILIFSSHESKCQTQQSQLIGHQEMLGYFNPAMMAAGEYAQLNLFHRNQWAGIGPKNNILYFSRPFLPSKHDFYPLSLGFIFQNEDLGIITRNGVSGSFSVSVFKNRTEQLNLGLLMGMNISGLKLDDFDLVELSDPEVINIDRRLAATNRLGLTYNREGFEIGVSAGATDFKHYADLHSFIRKPISLRNPKYVVTPIVVYRSNQNFEPQLEAQLRGTYDNLVSLTAGYRQDFGIVFQIGFYIKRYRARGSYGFETPQGNSKELGVSNEILFSIDWETIDSKKRKLAIAKKAERDSIRMAKRDSIRDARALLAAEAKQDSANQIIPDSLVVEEDAINFEDIPMFQKPIHDNTHVIMDHIHFERGQDIIAPESFEQLDQLSKYLKHHHHFRIEVQGHSDNKGSFDENMDLSERRAKAVANYILSRGIQEERVDIKGFGPTVPIAPNNNDKNRKLNRRVEIVFHTID
ncbi:type IX secretion system membrane protein PorP/SprF [Reichenbachiella versicolor]|uniref:type IX secretion system membrane protein PorP/SprF n=1 Tax=Reichenbachiella versicolor TaxID=1821036 RepID=UPI0013A5760B|nr:type IX secretion system membrane protein PorP/SprF [Reichenbachiella versicolor]